MQTWKHEDIKAAMPDGEWQDEPDKMQWIDEETGLDCLIVRGPSGALCGYVGLPKSHKLHGVHYDTVYETTPVEVHWGLTFSEGCQKVDDPGYGICHSGDIANKGVWWLGFDCAHSGDFCPNHDMTQWAGDVYRNVEYVKSETASLAKQLAEVK